MNVQKKKKKPLKCRLGFHSVWGDSVGRNHGNDQTPVYIMETTYRCHDCDWSSEVSPY